MAQLRIGAFTTIAAIAADARIAAAYPGIAASRARPRDAADPPSRDARRQPRAAFALLVFSQSAYRLPEEGRQRIARPDRAIISTASPSISAPASRRIPRPWRRRCSPMTRGSSPTGAAGCRSAICSATARNGRADHALQPGEMIKNIELRVSRSPASARSTSARSAAPMRNGRWSRSAPAPWSRTARSSSSASPPAASRRCRCGFRPPEAALAGQAGRRRDDRGGRQAIDRRRKAVADDGLQARSP